MYTFLKVISVSTLGVICFLSFVFKRLLLADDRAKQSKIEIVPLCEALAVPFSEERSTPSRPRASGTSHLVSEVGSLGCS